jgi:hypothetical protein
MTVSAPLTELRRTRLPAKLTALLQRLQERRRVMVAAMALAPTHAEIEDDGDRCVNAVPPRVDTPEVLCCDDCTGDA